MNERDTRRKIAAEAPLNPLSLVGSWGVYDGGIRKQALVVGEVQPGVYLLEFYDTITDQPRDQQLWPLKELVGADADGGTWHWFDDEAAMRNAFLGMAVA